MVGVPPRAGWKDAKRSDEQDWKGMDGGRRYAASSIVYIGAVEQRTMARGGPPSHRENTSLSDPLGREASPHDGSSDLDCVITSSPLPPRLWAGAVWKTRARWLHEYEYEYIYIYMYM